MKPLRPLPLPGAASSLVCLHSMRLTTTAAVPMTAKMIGTAMQSDFLIVFQLILDGVMRV